MVMVKSFWNLHGCNFWFDMYFSNFRLRIISAPYFPCVPLSTSRKYAWRLFNTANFDLFLEELDFWMFDIFFKEIRIYLGELILWHGTSRLCPSNSWFFSTIPQGAIPILTTRPERCCPSIDKASPTCFVTPICTDEVWNVQKNERKRKSDDTLSLQLNKAKLFQI